MKAEISNLKNIYFHEDSMAIQTLRRLTGKRHLVIATLISVFATGTVVSARASPAPGLCHMNTYRGAVPAKFPIDACVDGRNIWLFNTSTLVLRIARFGAIGKPHTTPTDFGLAASATRIRYGGDWLIMPGDKVQIPIGLGTAAVNTGVSGRAEGFYALANTVATFIPINDPVDSFTQLIASINADFNTYKNCKTGKSALIRARCLAKFTLNLAEALADAGLEAAKGLLQVLVAAKTYVDWLKVQVPEVGLFLNPPPIKQAKVRSVMPAPSPSPSKNGVAWRESLLPQQFGFDNNGSVVCPSVTVCYVPGQAEPVGGAFANTDNAAKSWSDYQLGDGSGTTNGMSCPSSTVCYAPGNSNGNAVVYKTSDGGQSWSSEPLPGDLGGFDGYGFLTCPSTAECFEPDPDLADVLTTTDGGSHWFIESLPASSDGQVACPSTANCYAAVSGDSSVMATQNGGQHWSIAVLPSGDQLFGTMNCPSPATCFALTQSSSTVATTTNGGTSWQNEQLPSGGQEVGISCASAEFCAATNQTGAFYTTDGGEIWSSGSVPKGVAFMYGVQCPSTTTCYAEGQPVLGGPVEPVVTTDGGLTWSTQVLPDNLSLGEVLDCPSATACFGPDLSGSIVTNATESGSG